MRRRTFTLASALPLLCLAVGCGTKEQPASEKGGMPVYSISNNSPYFRVAYGVAGYHPDAIFQLWPDGSIHSDAFVTSDEGLRHLFAGWNTTRELSVRLIINDAEAATEAMISSAVARIYMAAKSAKDGPLSVVVYLQSKSLGEKIGISPEDILRDGPDVRYSTPTVRKKN